MKHSIQFKKIAQRIWSGRLGNQTKQIMHPWRDWYIGILLCLVTISLIGGWSAQFYLTYRNFSVDTEAVSTQVTLYRESFVLEALTIHADKADSFAALQATSAAAPAPQFENIVIPEELVPEELSTPVVGTTSDQQLSSEIPDRPSSPLPADTSPSSGFTPPGPPPANDVEPEPEFN
jgi:hypothetical protein